MSGTLNDQLNQIADTKSAIADAINSKGIQVSENDPFATYATKIKQIQGGEGGNAFNLFDIKIADHKLEGNEALGWAEQGTNVYKTEYPDFYEKCLEEYSQGKLTQTYAGNNITVIGTLINDKGTISGFNVNGYAQTPLLPLTQPFELRFSITTDSNVASSTMQQYFAANSVTALSFVVGNGTFSYYIGDGQIWLNTKSTQGIVGNNNILPNTKYYIKAIFDGNAYSILISTDNIDWVEDYSYETTSYPGQFVGNIGTSRVITDGFWGGLIHLDECEIYINNSLYWSGVNYLNVHTNDNGHSYYTIDSKQLVDILFEETRNADLYGIDEELEYIILPRNSHFNQEEAIRKTYYCVGNTVKDESIIDISKEIELNNPFFLGQSQYFKNEPNNLSWLKSNGEFHSKEIYPSMYEYISENVKAGTKDFADINSEYDDYCYIIDEQNETFRLPLLNGSEKKFSNERYIDLDFTSHDITVVAPANGWYYCNQIAGTTSAHLAIARNTNGSFASAPSYRINGAATAGTAIFTSLDVNRGEEVRIYGNATGEVKQCRFYYNVGNGSLYYFVGESVQNANIIDASKLQKEVVNAKQELSNRPTYEQVDGEWVESLYYLIPNQAAPTTNVTVSLSDYLPNDDYIYEVIIDCSGTTGSSSGNGTIIPISTDLITFPYNFIRVSTGSAKSIAFGNCTSIIVGTGRTLTITGQSSNTGKYSIYPRAYRRVGKKS